MKHEPDCVSTILVEHQVRIGVVSETFAHLLAVGSEDETGDDQVLPRRSTEQMGRKHEQRVEPSSRLIDAFRYEISREIMFEKLFVLEWIVDLGIWHADAKINFWLDEGSTRGVLTCLTRTNNQRLPRLSLGHHFLFAREW